MGRVVVVGILFVASVFVGRFPLVCLPLAGFAFSPSSLRRLPGGIVGWFGAEAVAVRVFAVVKIYLVLRLVSEAPCVAAEFSVVSALPFQVCVPLLFVLFGPPSSPFGGRLSHSPPRG